MDASWLGFSLSNTNNSKPMHGISSISSSSSTSDSSNLCLFEAFTTTTTTTTTAGVGGATELSIFTGVPKVDNFFSTETAPHGVGAVGGNIYDSDLKTIAAGFLSNVSSTNQNDAVKQLASETTLKKTVDTFGQRTSIYRGVTRHRWTGRYEAHLWDNSCRRQGQTRKGRQGGYDKEEKAARAYDLAALKYWGSTTTTNFPMSNYEKELEEMRHMTRQEFVASLRRKSSGFSRGASIYRGVTRHHQHGRWQARIGRVAGNKDLYLGTFSTQEEAAEAYDIAAIKFRGLNAVTNFDMNRYDAKSIANSNLPVGGLTKNSSPDHSPSESHMIIKSKSVSDGQDLSSASSSLLSFAMPIKQDPSLSDYWSNILGYQNKNPISSTGFNMDLLGSSSNNSVGLMNSVANGGCYSQQQHSSGSPIFPLALNSNIGGSSSSWSNSSSIASSPYSFQATTAKPTNSLSAAAALVLQTPIFGME
ncbi:hypothetical protein HS088_TW09G00954 [Tripterygium wilfordii]|uniref:AP2/ERF domain-containing protein n=1 Tax=Tripterygium wilfordii TaxID=458696 RepID=A0A7J7D979_TRIWF|nr:hypothetical protein HS088_TW09G00954 [Tripterygium wilfordii]